MYINVKEQTIIKTHLKVAKVVDGDGIIVSNLFNKQEEEIRLLGIDAPELRRCRKLNQDERETHVAGQLLMELGRMSHKFLLTLAPPETNITIAMENANQTDTYGRTLAYVFLPDGRCLNELMITNGYARTFDLIYCTELYKYQTLNSIARNKKLGLYSIVERF
jgi:micrococcal nuclease